MGFRACAGIMEPPAAKQSAVQALMISGMALTDAPKSRLADGFNAALASADG
ncbi:MAG: hypothetical protein WDO70_01715 [Alphaproteobacteria bacterium]